MPKRENTGRVGFDLFVWSILCETRNELSEKRNKQGGPINHTMMEVLMERAEELFEGGKNQG